LDRPNFCSVVKIIPPDWRPCEQLLQVSPRLGFDRVSGSGEPGFEEAKVSSKSWVVQVVAIGQDDDGRVLHAWMRITLPA
jgi:hypothetical protein